jgi:chitin deacetylase
MARPRHPRLRKALIIGAGSLAVVIAILIWPTLLTSPLSAMIPNMVWRGPHTQPRISLTFDDGPDPAYTPQVLHFLAENHIHATFFLVGERIRKYPELADAIRAGGHEIGSHSDSWDRTWPLPLDKFERDLLRAEASLDLPSQPQKFFRPAGGWARPSQIAFAKQHGYTLVLGTAYGFDPQLRNSRFIAWEIGRALRPGAIIVLHDSGGNRQETVAALPRIIESARAQNLQFVTLSNLLSTTPRP